MALALGCSSKGEHPPYEPNPPLAASERSALRIAVVELESWNPPDVAGSSPYWNLIPGVLWNDEGTTYDDTGIARCLYLDLRASRAFETVDYFGAWPEDREVVESYDFVVSGRLLEDGVAKLASTFGLSVVGIPYLALLGTPNWSSERSLEFELWATRPLSPMNVVFERRVHVDPERIWLSLYTADQRSADDPHFCFQRCPTEGLGPHFAKVRDQILALREDIE